MSIAARWREVRAAVDAACVRAGRDPAAVAIVAVSKRHPAAAIEEVAAAGATEVGENYAQELVEKQAEVRAAVHWHFIGRLQRNKARMIAGKVALIHAVDSVELAEEIGRRALAGGATQAILAAINVGGEIQKSGVEPGDARALILALGQVPGIRLEGLMTMPPPTDEAERVRPAFRALRELRDNLSTPATPLPHLSMGMSADFEVAIAEGATLVRIGTAIFGERSS